MLTMLGDLKLYVQVIWSNCHLPPKFRCSCAINGVVKVFWISPGMQILSTGRQTEWIWEALQNEFNEDHGLGNPSRLLTYFTSIPETDQTKVMILACVQDGYRRNDNYTTRWDNSTTSPVPLPNPYRYTWSAAEKISWLYPRSRTNDSQ